MATAQPFTTGTAATTGGSAGTTTAETTTFGPLVADAPQGALTIQAVNKVYIAPGAGGELVGDDDRNVLVGFQGNDVVDGGNGDDLVIGGGGTNILTGGGDTDIFGHMAGARDLITDFAPEQEEKLVLQQGLSLSSSESSAVNVPSLNLSDAQAMILTFSDDSTIALVGVTDTPTDDWFA